MNRESFISSKTIKLSTRNMEKDKVTPLSTWCFFISSVLLVTSLWMILSNWHDFKGALLINHSSLAVVDGGVISSSITTSKWKNKTYYHYSIKYVYQVSGNTYYSDEVTFNDNYSLKPEFAQGYVAKYPVGKKVIVYYDPLSPGFSVLEPQESGHVAIKLLFLIVTSSAFVLSGAFWLFRRRFRNTPFPADNKR